MLIGVRRGITTDVKRLTKVVDFVLSNEAEPSIHLLRDSLPVY